MFNVAIVEDEESCLNQMKEILERYGREKGESFKITSFINGIDFVTDFSAEFDIVFMDIDMPHMDGLETAKLMRRADRNVALVFVTNLARYAIKGYEVDARDFIVKPIVYDVFAAKLSRIIERVRRDSEPYLIVTTRTGKSRIFLSDIYYITVQKRYVVLHTKAEDIEMHISMKELEARLQGSTFVRGDNSSMVNLMYVTSVTQEGAVVNGKVIPCSRNRRKALLDAFTLYLK